MTMELRVETTHTQTIKPSSPTPLSLKTFKLSLLEQTAPAVYVTLIFWFDPNGAKASDLSRRLKQSLSQTLTRFYPFAGRINHSFIDCNDEGVDFVEARVNCRLQHIFKRPDAEMLGKFLPMQKESSEAATGRVLLVKLNLFECGGVAIGVSISNKVSDLYTLGKFINSWAATTKGSSQVMFPEFGSAKLFLPPTNNVSFTTPVIELKRQHAVFTRLIFDASKISLLKARAASISVPQPTRVEAVAALLWKNAMAASTSSLGGFTKPALLRQVVNLRRRMKPPLPKNSVGYLVSYFNVKSDDSSMETGLRGLTIKLRNGIREFSENYVKSLKGSDAMSTIIESAKEVGNLSKRSDINYYNCFSWCGFDVYEADFGWGKPIWVSVAGSATPNSFVLMDTRDGQGIEAWVGLREEEMAFFKSNEELLAFATMDPSVI